MSDMPEKIWADTTCEWYLIDASWHPEDLDGLVSYIREDVAEARIAAARAEALEEAARVVEDTAPPITVDLKAMGVGFHAASVNLDFAKHIDAIRALAEKGEG